MALAIVCHTMQVFMFLPCPLDSGYLKGSIPFLFISLFPVMHMGTWWMLIRLSHAVSDTIPSTFMYELFNLQMLKCE